MLKKDRGSLTVEASIIIPFFMCIVFTFTFLIKVFIAYEIMQLAVTEAASEISTYSYIYWVSGVGKGDRILENSLENGSEIARNDLKTFTEAYTSISGLPENMQERVLGGKDSLNRGELDTVYQEVNEAHQDIQGTMERLNEAYTTGKDIFENPLEEVKSILSIVGSGANDDVKAFLTGQLTRWLMKKNLVTERFPDAGRRMKSLKVVDGLHGLDFSSTRIFDNGQQDIDIIVRYKIRSGLPFGILPQLNMVNRVVTRGWMDGDESGFSLGKKTAGSVWDLSNFERNKAIRKTFNSNLPVSFPGLVSFERSTGKASDLRSMDLRKPTYSNPEVVKLEVLKEITALSEFKEGKSGAIEIKAENIKSKEYILLVPNGSISEKMSKVLDSCKREAANKGIGFRLEELK